MAKAKKVPKTSKITRPAKTRSVMTDKITDRFGLIGEAVAQRLRDTIVAHLAGPPGPKQRRTPKTCNELHALLNKLAMIGGMGIVEGEYCLAVDHDGDDLKEIWVSFTVSTQPPWADETAEHVCDESCEDDLDEPKTPRDSRPN